VIKLQRFRLSLKTPPRVHVPANAAPEYILRRDGDQWLIAMLHGGREIHAFTPKQARRQANKLIDMAWLATHPGECPQGAFE
jgi:hypothetical protein